VATVISTIIIAVATVSLIAGGALLLISIAATLGPHCRCGHHRSVHKGVQTECSGMAAMGVNELGIRQWRYCPCRIYRKTDESYWDRLRDGTEDRRK
jgi:hypothetical protein